MRSFDVFPDRGCDGIVVAATHCLHEFLVRFGNGVVHRCQLLIDLQEGKQRRAELVECPVKCRIPSRLPNQLVKPPVGFHDFEVIFGRGLFLDPAHQVVEFGELFRSRPLRSVAERQAFQGYTNADPVTHFCHGQTRYGSTAVGCPHDQAIMLQLRQCFTDSRLANVEVSSQSQFSQDLARFEFAPEDGLPDAICYLDA